jgi:hypothetical protein
VFRPEQTPVVFDEPPIREDDAQTVATFELQESPIEADDTRPRPTVTAAEATSVEHTADEGVYAPEYAIDESRFAPPRETEDTVRSQPAEAALDEVYAPPEAETAAEAPVVEHAEVEDALEPPAEAPEAEAVDEVIAVEAGVTEEIETPSPAAETYSPPMPSEAEPMLPSADPERSAASIWEVFGVPRPSEATEAAPAAAEVEPSAPAPEPVSRTPVVAGQGLRVRLRRDLIRVRRPF